MILGANILGGTVLGGATFGNVSSYPWRIQSQSRSSANFANKITVLGAFNAPFGAELRAIANDVPSQTALGRVVEVVVVNREIDNSVALALAAEIELSKRAMQEQIVFEHDVDGLEVGEVVHISSLGAGISGNYLVQSLSMRQATPDWTIYTTTVGTYQPSLIHKLRLLDKIKTGPKLLPPVPPPPNSVTGPMVRDGSITGPKIDGSTLDLSTLNGQLNFDRIDNLGSFSIGDFVGQLDVGRIDNLGTFQIGDFSGLLDLSQVDRIEDIDVGTLSGVLDVSNVSNLNTISIGSFAGVILNSQIAAGLLDDLTKFGQELRPITRVGSLPTLPNAAYPVNTIVLLTTTGVLYKNITSVWTTVAASDTVTGKLVSTDIISVNAGTLNGILAAGVVSTISVSALSGTLSVGQAGAISISTLNGNLDVSRLTNLNTLAISSFAGNLDVSRLTNLGSLNINSFTGSIGQLNATTVTLTGQWGNSAISGMSATKLTAGVIDASVISVINLSASNIVSGTLSANFISGGTVSASVTLTSPTLSITSGSFLVNIDATNGIKIASVPSNYSVQLFGMYAQIHDGSNGYDCFLEPRATRFTSGGFGGPTVLELSANPTFTGQAGIILKDTSGNERFAVVANPNGSSLKMNGVSGQSGTMVLDKSGGGTWTVVVNGGIITSMT